MGFNLSDIYNGDTANIPVSVVSTWGFMIEQGANRLTLGAFTLVYEKYKNEFKHIALDGKPNIRLKVKHWFDITTQGNTMPPSAPNWHLLYFMYNLMREEINWDLIVEAICFYRNGEKSLEDV